MEIILLEVAMVGSEQTAQEVQVLFLLEIL